MNWNKHYDGSDGVVWNIGNGSFYSFGGEFTEREPPVGDTIGAPYYTKNSSGYYFQLPQQRIFSYNSQTREWSSELLPKDIVRTCGSAYTQSVRNKVGYSLGGYVLPETRSSDAEIAFGDNSNAPGLEKMLAYNLKTTILPNTGKFNVSQLPDGPNGYSMGGTGQRVHAIMHCLDRVGNEGILVAFAGGSPGYYSANPPSLVE